MNRNLHQLGTSRKDALKKLQNALEARFAEPKAPSDLANKVMNILTKSKNMACLGGDDSFDATENFENIFEKLPSITSKDRASVASLLNKITFLEIESRFQEAVREEITNFLNGKSRTLATIPEESSKTVKSQSALEETIKRPSSSFARTSASLDPEPTKEAEDAKSGEQLFTNNCVQLLARSNKGPSK